MKSESIYRTIEECLVEFLQEDITRADEFLLIALEKYTQDNNLDELLHSIQCIATAKGDTLELVESVIVDKGALSKLLKETSTPDWESVLEALGYTRLQTSGQPIPTV